MPSDASGSGVPQRGWKALQSRLQQHNIATITSDTLGQVSSFLCATLARHDEDMFTFRIVPRHELHDTLFIRSRVNSLEELTTQFESGDFEASSKVRVHMHLCTCCARHDGSFASLPLAVLVPKGCYIKPFPLHCAHRSLPYSSQLMPGCRS